MSTGRARSAAEEQAFYEGFAAGWLDRARYEQRTARVSDAAETAAWVLGFEEGMRVGTDAAAKSAVTR